MRKLKAKIGDLMSTQTGGEGETIQAQPGIQTSPEEFSKDVTAPTEEEIVTPTDVKPVQEEGTPTSVEPTEIPVESPTNLPIESDQPLIPIEGQEVGGQASEENPPIWPPQGQEEIVPETQAPIESLSIKDTGNDPTTILRNDGTEEGIFDPSSETSNDILTEPNFNFDGDPVNFGTVDSDGDGIVDEPVFFSDEEKKKYEEQKTVEEFGQETVNFINEVENKDQKKLEQIKRNNEVLKGNQPVQTSYDQIASKVKDAKYTEYEGERLFEDAKYSPSANMQTFMSLFGTDAESIAKLAESTAAQTGYRQVADYAQAMRGYQAESEYADRLQNILNSGYSDGELRLRSEVGVGSETFRKGQKLTPQQKAKVKAELAEVNKRANTFKDQVDNFDFNKEILTLDETVAKELSGDQAKPVDLYKQFENRTNWKLKEIYSNKWAQGVTGGDNYYVPHWETFESKELRAYFTSADAQVMKRYAKWLDTEGRKLIQQDIKNGTSKAIDYEVKNFSLSGGPFGQSVTDRNAYLRELRNNIYEIEARKNYQKTGNIDIFTYSGFKATANRLSKLNGEKVNKAISDVSKEILLDGQSKERQWVETNKKIMMSQIGEAKKQMDALFQSKVEQAREGNADVDRLFNQYSSKIAYAQSDEEKQKISQEFNNALKAYPQVSKIYNEYQSALKEFSNKAQTEFTTNYATFKQDLYDNAVKDLQAGITKSIKEVYKAGVNNDLNVYENAQAIVNTKEFKDASFYEKRKMISDQWEREKTLLTGMVKSGKIAYPKTKEEAGKHWSQWTGSRAMTAEEKKKWNAELPSRTGNDARARFIFYAVDDLLYNPKGKPTAYGIQAFAREQLTELQAKKKSLGIKQDDYGDIIGAFGEKGGKQISLEEAKQMKLTEAYLKKIINTPETDQGAWNEIIRGFSDGFQIPFLGAIIGIQEKNTLKSTVDRYQRAGMDTYDLSLVDAYAAMNKISELKPNSFAYNVASGLAFTSTFMLEMMATGGFNAIGRSIGVKLTDAVINIGKNSADDVIRASMESAAQIPSYIDRTRNIVGFMTGGMLEGAISPRAYEQSVGRMIDAVSVQESGAYDGLIAIVDRNSGEGAFEAFTKGYANYMGMATIERLGAHIPTGKLTNDALQYMGTSTFMKRMFIGKVMRDYGFRSVDDAAEFLATNKIPWSGMVPEMMEEVLQGGWEALVTGDRPIFGIDPNTGEMNYMGMTAEELKTTGAVVAIFQGGMSAKSKVVAKINGDSKNVDIDVQNEDGTVLSVSMDKAKWREYNNMMSDPNLTWRSVSDMMSADQNLSSEQEAAIANVLLQVRGKEILEDESYQQWKEQNKAVLEKKAEVKQQEKDKSQKAYEALSEEQKKKYNEARAAANYDYMTVQGTTAAEDFARSPENMTKDALFNTIYQNEEGLNNPEMTIIEENPDGTVDSRDVKETAQALADESKKRKSKKLTRGGSRAAKQLAKQREKDAAKQEEEGLQFEMPKAKGAVTEEVPVTESTITTPIDLTNDQENITGVPSQVAEGAQLVETQPVAEAGQETPGVSGVVQEEQVQTEVVPTEEKSLEKIVQDTQDNETRRIENLSVEEYINEDFPLLSYEGQDELTRNQVDAYNKKSRKVNENGSFSNKYAESIIEYLATILPDRKLISAFRRAGLDIPQSYDISPDYRRSMGVSGYIRENIGLIANGYYILSESEKIQATKILSNAAENAGIKVATLESEANREVIKPSVETATAQATTEEQQRAVEANKKFSELMPGVTGEAEVESEILGEKKETTPNTQEKIDAINDRINEIYDNGEEDELADELAVLNEGLKELESTAREEAKTTVTETAPAEKQFEAVGPYFISQEDNGKWKLYNKNKESLGLTYDSREEVIDEYNKELEAKAREEATTQEVSSSGWVQKPVKIKKDVYRFEDNQGVGYIVKRPVGERATPMWVVSNDEEGTWDGSHNPFKTKAEAEKYIESFFEKPTSAQATTEESTTEAAPVEISKKSQAVARKLAEGKELTVKENEYVLMNQDEVSRAFDELQVNEPDLFKPKEDSDEVKNKKEIKDVQTQIFDTIMEIEDLKADGYDSEAQGLESKLKSLEDKKNQLTEKNKDIAAKVAESAPVAFTSSTKVEEDVPENVKSFRDRLLDVYDKSPKKSTKQYISGQQNSIDPIEREAAALALAEIEKREKEQAQAKKAPRKKAEEGPKVKTDSDGFVSVESIYRGVANKPTYDASGNLITTLPDGNKKGYYSVKLSEDGSKATVKDPTGKVHGPLKVSVNSDTGTRSVVVNGASVYVDNAIMTSVDTGAKAKAKADTEEKTGTYKKRVSSFYEPGKKTPNVGIAPSEINKLKAEAEALKKDPNYANNKKSINRVKEIEDIIDSNKGKISPKAVELERELQYDPKSEEFNSGSPIKAGIADPLGKTYGKQIDDARDKRLITEEEHKALSDFYEKKKTEYTQNKSKTQEEKQVDSVKEKASKIISDQINSEEATPEDVEMLQDPAVQEAIEVVVSPTTEESKKKGRGKKSLSATRRRGATVALPEAILTRLQKAFPNYINGVDTREVAFQAAARATGRSMNSAAIILDGIIYLNPRVANVNTALEEFSHLYLLVMQANNLPLFNKGISMIQQNPEYIDEVMYDPGYAYIHNYQNFEDLSKQEREDVSFEALSKMIADRGEAVLEEKRKSTILTYLRDFWKNIGRIVFGFSRKLDVARDNIDTYTDLIARELLKGKPISNITPDQVDILLQPYNNKDIKFAPLSKGSIMNFKSGWIGSARRLFAANKGVGENLGMKLKSASRLAQRAETQMQVVVGELNKGISKYNRASKRGGTDVDIPQLKMDIDRALKDPEFRTNWFLSDPLANQHIKPVVMKMRDMVDSLSKSLVDSGLFGEDLVASINTNNDVYLHTSYFIFSNAAADARKNWLQLFSDQDRKDIMDWVFKGAYSKANDLYYKVNPQTGEVKFSFINSMGVRTPENSLPDIDHLKEFVKQNVKAVIGGVPASIDNYSFASREGEIKLGAAMNIDATGMAFSPQEKIIESAINDLVGNEENRKKFTDFLDLQQQLVTASTATITKKKQKDMDPIKKKFLMEMQDPAYNFTSTISKQASLLYKSQLEQELIDGGFLAVDSNPDPGTQNKANPNWVRVSTPESKLYNKYVPVEVYDMLYGTDLIKDKQSGGLFNVYNFALTASAYTKMALTVLSMGANAANYVSGWFQLAKTGGLPVNLLQAGHRAAIMAVQTEMTAGSTAASVILNPVSTGVRGLVNLWDLAWKNRQLENQDISLTPLQQTQYGVSTYADLTPNQKAQVLASELIEMGVINSGIESEVLRNLSEYAFRNVEIPENALRQQMTKLELGAKGLKKVRQKVSTISRKALEASADSYQFSDSVFKAMMYVNTKAFNMKTYGEEMRRDGMTQEEIDAAIKLKTANQVRMQMPTYDRSPEFLRFLSRFPLIGPFVQFDFQNKINDKNIIVDSAKMMKDAARMWKKGLNKEAAAVFAQASYKSGMAIASQFLSYAIYSYVSGMFGWDDDDDVAMRQTQADYRKYNTLIHIDSDKTGIHEYIDINRVVPQALYLKYWRALKEDGVGAAISEFFDPYTTPDVFMGSVMQTFQNINKYGVYDKDLENLGLMDKLQYLFEQRLLPSTSVGQIQKLIRAGRGEEAMEGVPADLGNEIMNILFGVKIRSVRLDKTFGERLSYKDFKEIEAKQSSWKKAIKERDKRIEQAERGVEAATEESINDLQAIVDEERVRYEEFLSDKMNSLYALAESYRKLGFSDQQLADAMKKSDAPQYFINAVLYGAPIEYNPETGKRYSGGSSGGGDFDGGGFGGFDGGGFDGGGF